MPYTEYLPLVIGTYCVFHAIFSLFTGKASLMYRVGFFRKKYVFTWKEDPFDFVVYVILDVCCAALFFFVYFSRT